MNQKKVKPVLLLVAVMSTFSLGEGYSQNDRRQAISWFKVGVNAKTALEKIDAYERALKFDPNFTEALYNLGIAYKQLGEYRQAERYFERASQTRFAYSPGNLKLAVHYELFRVRLRLGKLRESEQSLRQCLKLTSDPRQMGKLWAELGGLLYDQARYEEAVEALKNAMQFEGTNQTEIRRMIENCRTEIELRKLYQSALSAEQRRDYQSARSYLQQLQQIQPHFRDVAERIATYDSILKENTKQEINEILYEKALKLASEEQYQQAVEILQQLLEENPGFKDADSKLARYRELLDKQRRQQAIARYLNEGTIAMRHKMWDRAELAFSRVLEMDPKNKLAKQKRQQARRKAKQADLTRKAEINYSEGLLAMQLKDYSAAIKKFETVARINPRYREVQSLLEAARKAEQGVVAAEAESEPLAQTAELDIGEAVDVEPYEGALAEMEMKEKKPVVQNTDLAASKTKPWQNIPPWQLGVVAFACGVVFFGLTFLAFSPTSRAKMHILRGNYASAARIYEKILEKNPERIRLYAELAGIYLMLDRNDEKAFKVYHMVARLNLNPPYKAKLDSKLKERAS
ncbi:MAG: tetratricopeptide repeat protein [candidate division KSB1 bacterium]|nr:tetratricopeptide repeat protein [candidate division KSB1 bacterium]